MRVVGGKDDHDHLMTAFLGPYVQAFAANAAAGRVGTLGFELELIMCVQDDQGEILWYVPLAHMLYQRLLHRYPHLGQQNAFGHEFAAVQIEVKTNVAATAEELMLDLNQRVCAATMVAREEFGCSLVAKGFLGDDDGPPVSKVINPTSHRYHEVARRRPDLVDHMVRVASGQIHLGCGSFDQAIRLRNALIEAMPEMIKRGWCDPRRYRAFNEHIWPSWIPPLIPETADGGMRTMFDYAMQRGVVVNPAMDWGAIRIHPKYGTVELRLLDPSLDWNLVQDQLRFVLEIAQQL